MPFIIRWPGKIPAGQVSNDIIHESDVYATLAEAVGGKVPADRMMDGLNQLDFLTGKAPKSSREPVIVYVGDQLYAVKWRNWKAVFKELDAGYGEPVKNYQTPSIYDLYNDPREEKPLAQSGFQQNGWVGGPIIQTLIAHMKTLKDEPPIKEGTPDPYVPKKESTESADLGVKENQAGAN